MLHSAQEEVLKVQVDSVFRLSSAVLLAGTMLCAQPVKTLDPRAYLSNGRLPGHVSAQADAVGDRLTKAGKERIVSIGTLYAGQAQFGVRTIWELRGGSRYEQGSVRIVDNGSQTVTSRGKPTHEEVGLIESIFEDSHETFLENVANGRAFRLVGRRFRPGRDRNAPYTGPLFDVIDVEVTGSRSERKDRQMKRYFFNSLSGQLDHTRYEYMSNGSKVIAETYFTQWEQSEGQWAPRVVERRENGASIFTLRLAAITFGAALNDSAFTTP
jgi:hypothetical protein